MSRVIKFRAWSKPSQSMVDVEGLYKDGIYYIDTEVDGEGHPYPAPARLDNDQIELMQFTGLTTKDSKEVYESDIVRTSWEGEEVIGNVYWSQYHMAWMLGVPGKNVGTYLWRYGNLELLGNKYENPELLSV